MDDSCAVCTESLEWVAYGPCGHKEVCSTCVVRLRFICQDRRCCICKSTSDFIFVTRALGDYTRIIRDFSSSFPSEPKEGRLANSSFWYHEDSQAFFDDVDHYKSIKARCTLSCRICDPKEEATERRPPRLFQSIEQLKGHLFHQHNRLLMCYLCLEGRKVFICDQKLYTRAQLDQHIKSGDSEVDGSALSDERGGFMGHPMCKFCRNLHYGDNELYTHMSTEHFTCHICQRRNPGGRYEYYRNYNDLEIHFRRDHFLCDEQACLEKKFIVFQSEAELKRHNALEHHQGMSRSKRNAALQLPTSFSFSTDLENRYRRGRGEGHSLIPRDAHENRRGREVSNTDPRDTYENRRGVINIDLLRDTYVNNRQREVNRPEREVSNIDPRCDMYGNHRGREVASNIDRPPRDIYVNRREREFNRPEREVSNINPRRDTYENHDGREVNRPLREVSNTDPRRDAYENRRRDREVISNIDLPLVSPLESFDTTYSGEVQRNSENAAPLFEESLFPPLPHVAPPSSSTQPKSHKDALMMKNMAAHLRARNLITKPSLPIRSSPAAVKLMARSSTTRPVSATVIPPQPTPNTEEIRRARKASVERIRTALDMDQDKFCAFKEKCAGYVQGSIDVHAYLIYVEQFGLSHLVDDLARLCPDASRRRKLIDTYNAYTIKANRRDVKSSKKGKEKIVVEESQGELASTSESASIILNGRLQIDLPESSQRKGKDGRSKHERPKKISKFLKNRLGNG